MSTRICADCGARDYRTNYLQCAERDRPILANVHQVLAEPAQYGIKEAA